MLICVVKYYYVDALSDGFSDSAHSIWRGDHRDSCVETLMHHRLIPTVTAKHNGRRASSLENLSGHPGRDGRLSCSTDREISDAQDRHRELFGANQPAVIELAADRYRNAIQTLEWR